MSTLKRRRFWGNVPKNKCMASENRFSALSTFDDDDDDFTYSESEAEPKEYKVVIPPIIVDYVHSFTMVYGLIGRAYTFKKMSIGTKIISPTINEYVSAKKKLTEAKFKFYTHELKDTKMYKLVLFGLPKLQTTLISDELKNSHNVIASSIKEIITSRSTLDDAIYVLEFDRSLYTKSQVKKIRHLCGIVIHWRKPTSSNKGPTLCTKCAMYGHGARNCFRNNICIACGGNHDYSSCPVNKTTQTGPVAYKCFNCSEKKLKNINHKADDPRCPCRKDYIILRQKLSSKTRRVPTISTDMYHKDNYDLPHPSGIQNSRPSPPWTGAIKKTYADALKLTNHQSALNSEDLFSIDELFNIFTTAVTDLRKCNSKAEQLNVIMSMLKYAI